jgi:ABC-type transporter Mla MlaB component
LSGKLVADSSEYSVKFSGNLTISNIVDAHAALAEAMEREDAVVVNLDDVAEADLTFAQLLEAARRTAAVRGRKIRLEKPAEGAMLQVLQRGGFLEPDDSERLNFWSGGKTQS